MSWKRFLPFLFVSLTQICFAQISDTIVLKNRFLERKFVSEAGSFYTSSFKNLSSGKDYSRKGSEEFSFAINGKEVSGAGDNAGFELVKKELSRPADGIQTLAVTLEGKASAKTGGIEVKLLYELYDELPVVRKHLWITNHSLFPIAISNLDVERLNLEPITQQQTDLYTNYGTHLDWRPYKGTHHDAAILVYHTYAKEGFILGNEAPSVLKRTEVFTHLNQVSVGMGKIDDHYPFKKRIEPGETFSSPGAFICMVKEQKWEDAFEGYFADFIRTRLGVKLFEKKQVPFAFYNTWRPFGSNINSELMFQLADGLEGTGIDLFIMDDGWQANFGDWEASPQKFPQGLKPVCDYIRKKGMKPGLWISLATASEDSKVYKEHPEWAVLDKDGKPAYLHDHAKKRFTMSMGSGYYDYILNKIKSLVKENELAYIKIDLAFINSAYVLDYERKGDYGSNGKIYRDRESSYYANYERTLKLFDELHATCPELLIDCTYEVWGEYYVNDFALIEHADYDWLTNYNDDPPVGPINIRQMSYDRTRVIPAATNLIGNQMINNNMPKYTFLSLASGKPILVGDARNFPVDLRKWYAGWNRWFKMMDSTYQFTRYTQISDIFPRPSLSNWDGCYKFNKEKQGGVLFFYRNGSLEKTRTFSMPLVDPKAKYRLYSPEDKKAIGLVSGKELLERGITVTIPNAFEAKVVGIEKVDDVTHISVKK
jgi:alpha-galactosidase